jgi:hypothetical protein
MSVAPKALAARRDERSLRGGPASSSRRRLAIVVVAAVAVALWAASASRPWQSWSHDAFWKIDRPLADPAPIVADGEVDVYATSASECFPGGCPMYWVPRYTSRSLTATAALQADAMPDRPPWVDHADRAIWGPSVARIGATYVMYFAATAAGGPNRGDKCIGTATSPTPAGPFEAAHEPMVCADPGFWALDPYAVADGTRWFLLWREDDAAHTTGRIVGAQLSARGLGLRGAAKRTILTGRFAWEDGSRHGPPVPSTSGRRLPAVLGRSAAGIGPIENPDVARDPDTGQWLLTWSANRWDTADYATGLATCRGPLGPCRAVSRDRPWLRTSDDTSIGTNASFTGAGGLSFVTAPDGHLYAVFAAYRGSGAPDDLIRVGWVYRVVAARDTYVLTEF